VSQNQYTLSDWVSKACQGKADALSWLYNQYAPEMYHTCMRMMGSRERAEDVLQESFITAFEKLKQLKDPLQFRSWLKKIMINNCLMSRQRERRHLELTECHYETPEEEDEKWIESLSIERIHYEIMRLPEGCRQVFHLFVFEDLTHKEIGELLQITESTSKSQYHRARTLLKKALQQEYNGSHETPIEGKRS
jgi:RNA polymerase sigma-70 factor (ECF subfamily)